VCGAVVAAAVWLTDGVQVAPALALSAPAETRVHRSRDIAIELASPTPTPTPTRAIVAAAPATTATTTPARSRTLDRALSLYKRKQYEAASIELYKVVQRETADTDADVELAELFLAKTLYHLDLPSASLAQLEPIARNPNHRQHRTALRWLGALATTLPDPTPVAALVAAYDPDDLDRKSIAPVRDELHYLLGRHHLTDADPQRAIEHFDAVAENSPRYLDARFMAAIQHVRAGDAKPAARALAEVADRAGGERAQAAILNLARLYYSTGNYDRAIDLFNTLPRSSAHWPTALSEASWAYFLAGRPERGLGHIHTLDASYFDGLAFPETLQVEATIYFDRCHFQRASRTIKQFERDYGPAIKTLKAISRRYSDDEAKYYRFATRLLARNPPPDTKARLKRATAGRGGSPSAWSIAAASLPDAELRRKFDQVEQLAAEIDRFDNGSADWKLTAVAVDALQGLTVQRSIAEADAGRLARARVQRALDDLETIRGNLRRIRIEILDAKASAIVRPNTAEPDHLTVYAIDDQLRYWPWQGEYWRDELGGYAVKIDTLCRE
jgi:tetratricopeptide (TPR) repeat protein